MKIQEIQTMPVFNEKMNSTVYEGNKYSFIFYDSEEMTMGAYYCKLKIKKNGWDITGWHPAIKELKHSFMENEFSLVSHGNATIILITWSNGVYLYNFINNSEELPTPCLDNRHYKIKPQ